MDEALSTRLDAIKDSIHELDTKLTRIEAHQAATDVLLDRRRREIDSLRTDVDILKSLHDQGKGIVLLARLIWVIVAAGAGLTGWLLGRH